MHKNTSTGITLARNTIFSGQNIGFMLAVSVAFFLYWCNTPYVHAGAEWCNSEGICYPYEECESYLDELWLLCNAGWQVCPTTYQCYEPTSWTSKPIAWQVTKFIISPVGIQELMIDEWTQVELTNILDQVLALKSPTYLGDVLMSHDASYRDTIMEALSDT